MGGQAVGHCAERNPEIESDAGRKRARIRLSVQSNLAAESQVTDRRATCKLRISGARQHHRQRSRDQDTIEKRTGEINVGDEQVIDERLRLAKRAVFIDRARHQRLVAVVQGDPGREVARRGIPRMIDGKRPLTSRGGLIAVELEATIGVGQGRAFCADDASQSREEECATKFVHD